MKGNLIQITPKRSGYMQWVGMINLLHMAMAVK